MNEDCEAAAEPEQLTRVGLRADARDAGLVTAGAAPPLLVVVRVWGWWVGRAAGSPSPRGALAVAVEHVGEGVVRSRGESPLLPVAPATAAATADPATAGGVAGAATSAGAAKGDAAAAGSTCRLAAAGSTEPPEPCGCAVLLLAALHGRAGGGLRGTKSVGDEEEEEGAAGTPPVTPPVRGADDGSAGTLLGSSTGVC